MKKFIDTYGNEKAKEVFYASKNKGTIEGVEEEVRPGTMGLAKGTTGHKKPTKTMGPAPGFPGHKPKKKKEKAAEPVQDSTYYKIGVLIAEWMSKEDLEQYKGRPSRTQGKKAGPEGVTPMSDKQKKSRELKAQADSDKDLEL